MARIRFLGPSARRRLEFPDGRTLSVSRGEVIELPDELAATFIGESGSPRMWEAADGPQTTRPRFEASDRPGVEVTKKSRMGKEDR